MLQDKEKICEKSFFSQIFEVVYNAWFFVVDVTWYVSSA